jgi:hypothetical protein
MDVRCERHIVDIISRAVTHFVPEIQERKVSQGLPRTTKSSILFYMCHTPIFQVLGANFMNLMARK